MNNTIVFSAYCQGADHKPNNKPCQDYASHYSSEETAIIALSDGHGGKKYFRSQYGAQIATEIAINTLNTFCKEADFEELLGADDLICVPVSKEAFGTPRNLEYVMRHVFQHICSEWHRKIEEHFQDNSLTLEEEEFLKKETVNGTTLYDYYFDPSGECIKKNLPSAYGCTLFGVAETKNGYWVGFHIGDGKCIAFNEDGAWYEPIPWDERCFLNKTTSLSHYGDESFRYCIGRNLPAAIFIASDGMDDSYAPMDELAFEYAMNFMANLAVNGEEYTSGKIASWLDKISEYYSKDDMSIGYIVASERLRQVLNNYMEKEEPVLNHKRDVLSREVQDKNTVYETKLKRGEDIRRQKDTEDHKIKDLENEAIKMQEQYDENREKIETKSRSRCNFLRRLSKPAIAYLDSSKEDVSSDREKENHELDIKINAIGHEIEKNVLENEKLSNELSALVANLPVIKKHATEATKNLNVVENKIRRINRVKESLNK
ncbi:MAG: hypothetical protein HDS26_04855 [Bacteroides sp.]|nr:hypothetical protein [Bacteroides sp.]